ncbi:hypothetical protein ACFCW7_23190 [Paenibacillus glucanolyticus]|uniref:hypothetical protein n=1 Tax=Paenibacillus glucanolyticus TaxID=59843 RepID=UPI0035D992A9
MLVHNKGNYVRNHNGVRLIPGANNISEEDWKDFSSHPLNKILIEKQEIVAHEDEGKAMKLADMNQQEATLLIKDTYDLNLLAELLQEEESGKNRKGVIEVIAKQAEEIEKSIEDAKKKAQE